jgi:large subunit ribosomal protein L30
MEKIKVTLVRSTIDTPKKQKLTVKALGLRRLNQSVIHNATPQILGMIQKVKHLVKVEKVEN